MAKARAAAAVKESELPIVEELHFRSDNAFLCLLLNRRTKAIRVIDFRAGALPAKRLFIQSVAQREGVEKVILLVEKDEVSSWTRVGFVREGQVPGFYKRSDGHLVGCVIGDRTASIEVSEDSQKIAERTINAAKKLADGIEEPVKGVTVQETDRETAEEARDALWVKRADTYGCFDAFGRDATRTYVEVTSKKIKPNYLSDPNDQRVLNAGIRMTREIFAQKPLSQHSVEELVPGPGATSDEALAEYCRGYCTTIYHPVGTCRMGQGPAAVVDDRLRVHGIGGLRVADASIMPTLTTGNTNAPTIMIGEKAAVMIREDMAA